MSSLDMISDGTNIQNPNQCSEKQSWRGRDKAAATNKARFLFDPTLIYSLKYWLQQKEKQLGQLLFQMAAYRMQSL